MPRNNLHAAFQMDALEKLNPRSDSTFLLIREAQKRGYTLWHYTPDKLTWRDGKITALARQFVASPDISLSGGETVIDLSSIQAVWLRQDPPFNMEYITTTHLLEQLPKTTRVVNDPASVRNHPEKLFPMLLREFMPQTLVSANKREIEAFRDEYGDIVMKPLYGYGGRGVVRIRPNDENFATLLEMQFANSQEPVMVQPFLREVKDGDRRIILIDGEVGGIMGRIPAEGEIRANFRVGGTAVKAELTPRQRELCEILRPLLKKLGLIFVGLDVIGDYLTEINITSPTGLVAMNGLYGKTLEADIWDAAERTFT